MFKEKKTYMSNYNVKSQCAVLHAPETHMLCS